MNTIRMNTYFSQFKALGLQKNVIVSHTMHNVYTLPAAAVRDASGLEQYINLNSYCTQKDTEVCFLSAVGPLMGQCVFN